MDILHIGVEDPRAAEWGGHTLNLLQPCGDGKTKYQALFHPLTTPGATDYRQCFFHVSQDERGEALIDTFLQIFDTWRQPGAASPADSPHVLTREENALAEKGFMVLNRWFSQRRSHPVWPRSFTEIVGWPALRQSLLSSRYWLSPSELQCVAACWSCRVHVYINNWISHPPSHLRRCRQRNLPMYSAAMRTSC